MRYCLLLLCMELLSLTAIPQSKKNDLPPGLDGFVNDVLHTFRVPGVSIAIVKDGEVLLQKGYGVKEAGRADSVDEHTLFCIASNTKAFTAAAIAMLVEEKKLEWDQPVIRYLPWFRLSDPYVTRQITVRDLLVHRSGLGTGTGDLLQFPPTTYSRNEIVERLSMLPLEKSFRSGYAYSNGMFLAAASVIEAVSGQTWEEFVRTRILSVLDMKESITNISMLLSQPNVAKPHQFLDGKLTTTAVFPTNQMGDAVDPAGGISSNAVDMSKWLLTQLDSGRAKNGRRIFPAKAINELWDPATPVPVTKMPASIAPMQMSFAGYAPGFHIRDYRKEKIVTHTGGLSGAFYSRVTLVPSLGLGVAVLTNCEVGNAFNAISNQIIDHYLGAPHFNWLKACKEYEDQLAGQLEAKKKSEIVSRDSLSRPSLPLARYTGTYRDPAYGDVIVFFKGDSLAIRFRNTPVLTGSLEHWQYNTFVARWTDRSLRCDAYVTFVIDADGSVSEVKMKALPGVNFSRDYHNMRLKPYVSPEVGRGRAIRRIDTAVRNFMAAYAVPGVSIAVTRNGKLVYEKGYGYADQENERLVNDSSLFRIASISKTITSAAIMKLVKEGKLKLDDPVFGKKGILGKRYRSKKYAKETAGITVRNLLNHTSGGWKNGRGTDPIFLNPAYTTEAQIKWTLENQAPENAPGEKYAYSNFGFWLLGEIVAEVTGVPYEAYVKKNILAPAGITDMELGENAKVRRRSNEVVYYGQIPSQQTDNWNMKRIGAAGGWVASARDLVKLLAKLEGTDEQEPLLEKSTIDTMTTVPGIAGTNYACGWRVANGNWWHQGSLPGTGTQLLRGANGVSCAFLCNTRGLGTLFFKQMEDMLLKIVSDPSIQWPEPIEPLISSAAK